MTSSPLSVLLCEVTLCSCSDWLILNQMCFPWRFNKALYVWSRLWGVSCASGWDTWGCNNALGLRWQGDEADLGQWRMDLIDLCDFTCTVLKSTNELLNLLVEFIFKPKMYMLYWTQDVCSSIVKSILSVQALETTSFHITLACRPASSNQIYIEHRKNVSFQQWLRK